jgi:hypothetical protein
MIYGLLQQLQSLGLNLPEVLKQLGSTTDTAHGRIATGDGTTTPEEVAPPRTAK